MTAPRALILAIDDAPANLMTLGSALEGEFELQIATSGPDGIKLAMKRPPDLILLDVMMPEVDGFETFKRLAALPTLSSVPVIFVTALNDVDSEVTGLSLGAADYITKPINVAIARHRIRNLLERENLRREVERQRRLLELEVVRRADSEERVRDLAFHDELTGLPNRRMLTDRLSLSMASGKRSGLYGALMYLDLDNFKPLNDEHGHEFGDMLLVEVARRLTDCVCETDTVARVGGDEFVVILSELDSDTTLSATQARAVAEKIRASLALPYTLKLHHDEQQDTIVQHDITVSIGVALFSGHEANQIYILKNADALMYEAKESGRNTIRFHESESAAIR